MTHTQGGGGSMNGYYDMTPDGSIISIVSKPVALEVKKPFNKLEAQLLGFMDMDLETILWLESLNA